jgi:hypothetical protein
VEILEVDSACLQYDAEGLVWPADWPQIEGAMIWYVWRDPAKFSLTARSYDAQDKTTLAPLRTMLSTSRCSAMRDSDRPTTQTASGCAAASR